MIRITKVDDKSQEFRLIHKVYNEVFPKNERLPLWFLKMRATAGKAEFCSIYNDEEWVGFFYTVYDKRMAYLFFLAIDPQFHGQGFGSEALTLIKKRYAGKTLALSTERPTEKAKNNEQRIRRHRFYTRNGFVKAGFYTVEKDSECFDLMVQQVGINPQHYQRLVDNYLKKHRHHYLPF